MAKSGSFKVDFKKGMTIFWCTCGKSTNQPFCNGSHKGTEFKPLKYTWDDEDKTVHVCGCKVNQHKSGPFCDRSHKHHDLSKVSEKPVGYYNTEEHYKTLKHDDLRDCTVWFK